MGENTRATPTFPPLSESIGPELPLRPTPELYEQQRNAARAADEALGEIAKMMVWAIDPGALHPLAQDDVDSAIAW